MDAFLRTGGNQRLGVLHIIAHHQLQGEDFPALVRSEFCGDGGRNGGRGLFVNGVQYAAWYDPEGIRVAPGSTVRTENAALFTWEQAADRIDSLLHLGLYQPEVVVRQAIDREYLDVAGSLWYIHQDYVVELDKPFFLEDDLFSGGFPESTARIAEQLRDPSVLARVREGLEGLVAAEQEGHSLLRWRYHNPKALVERMEKLSNSPLQYPLSSLAPAELASFISEDEIDGNLLNHTQHGTERNLTTYSYMIQNHSLQEQAEHFKNLFGISGYSHGVSHADDSYVDYDTKGVKLRRGEVTVQLSWNQYVRRMRELVLSGRFLTQEDIDQIPAYERLELAKRIVRFFDYKGEHSPLPKTDDFHDPTKPASEMLDTPLTVDRIHDAMLLTLSGMDEKVEHYQPMMAIYTDVAAFRAGNFSLFTPAAELEAQAQKRGVSLFVHPGRHLSRDEMVYEFREGSTVFLDNARFEIAETDAEYVTLRDVSFPLIASRYSRAELSDLLRRDTRNDYLLVEPVEVAGEQQTQDVVNNPVPTVQNQSEEKPEESEQTAEDQRESTPSEREPEPETERQRERESGEEEPAPEPEQESEEQDPLYTFEPYRVEDVEQAAEEEEEEEEEPPYEVVLAPTVELVGLFAIFSHLNDDFVRDGEDIRGFETQEDAEAFIETLMQEEQTVDTPQREPEPVRMPAPSIEPQEKRNFRITDDVLGTGGSKAKFQRNLAAIELVHRLEREGRMATAEEQEVLAQYVGWGGIAQAFDEHNDAWANEYQKLRAELTPEEYAAARGSTLNAHYTSPAVIREMYAGLERMGFTGGNLLEPAMGVGNFFGMLPESLSGSTRLYGVELDEITGKIAKQLYQQADIAVKGFEKTDFSNDFFDVVIGNVPFGNYQVSDRAYDRHHFMIHDYFLAKSLDKVRPGGVVAVITSVGTLDKKDEAPRRYLAERANLLGAVRLPNNAFRANAGTDVITDILFLQKREAPTAEIPDWVHLGVNQAGFQCNRYFAAHPEMVLGEWTTESTQYGKMQATIKPIEGADLSQQLQEAIGKIEGSIRLTTQEVEELEDEVESIPADPSVRNYSYTVVDDELYYRENSIMRKVDLPAATMERIRGMVSIRDITQRLINAQLWESSEGEIVALQQQLNAEYDRFTKKYGIISSNGNKRAFALDSSYCLLKSLEVLDDEGNLERKADMFTRRTIKRAEVVDHVDTPSEALAVSIAEKAGVDVEYMAELMNQSVEDLLPQLEGVIFQDPSSGKWLTADEYLSGNVREKLRIAQGFAEGHPEFQINVEALRRVQPKDLTASEIDVRLGATWIKPEYITQFMGETFQTPFYLLNRQIRVQYSKISGNWNITGKNADSFRNVYATKVYGTNYVNGYRLLEDALNLRDTRIMEKIQVDGVEKTVVNKKETMLAQQKQDAIREAFQSWVFKDPQRRADLVREYNERFNSVRPRQYDGSHITFFGMNPEISLREHQRNAVAHILYGGNTLLAHCVGAGKTYEMAAAAMESKRLGLCQKSLFVVPNHLVEQWGAEFLQLYPGANLLVATKKDFQPANRKAFCARIATGNYDAVIIGHSQFEKIPLSLERQRQQLEDQIDELVEAIGEAKESRGENFTIKQMEKTRKNLQVRLEKLNNQSRKDDVVTFEQLGVDRLFVDESHGFKNLFLFTKMRNVAGISQTEAQKSSDMFAKCRYMDELTGGKGVTFATGTPISNSMVEMFTLMRYLQYDTLQRMELGSFDAWASTFGEKVTAVELSPEGTGYRSKTRFAKFFNLPELISVFKEAADVQTADMLQLPVPKAVYEDVVLEPSEFQQEMVSALADRAETVRNGAVDAREDNMLRITSDGRKLALDQRLMNDMLPDNPDSKVNACVEKVHQIWVEGMEQKTTQLIFCDLSTPKGDGKFNVYDDIREKLVKRGVPKEEIAFIHEADTEARKVALFAKVRSGQVRVLMGSTAKCGAGMNIQTRLIALHHLDVPWKPSEVERTLRTIKLFLNKAEFHCFYNYTFYLHENGRSLRQTAKRTPIFVVDNFFRSNVTSR